jgi:CRP/FNR family transcriptional regulator, cyclic AMP receptor protein
MIMELAETFGYLATVLAVAASCMRTMAPLRILSIASNLTFLAYGVAAGLLPILAVHSILLSMNSIRLFQLQRLVRSVKEAARGDLALDSLLPFMTTRRFAQGEILFRKNDPAHEMFYVLSGEIHLRELDRTIGAGSVLGEISMFSPDRARTATAVCASDGELLAMSEDQVKHLYFQNPRFGFHLVHLITARLIENCASLEALPGRWPEVEGLRATDAA